MFENIMQNGLLGWGGAGGLAPEPQGLLGQYYDEDAVRKATIKQMLMLGGLGMMSGGIQGAAKGASLAAIEAPRQFREQAMDAWQMDRQSKEDEYRNQQREQEIMDRQNQQVALNGMDPEIRKYYDIGGASLAGDYMRATDPAFNKPDYPADYENYNLAQQDPGYAAFLESQRSGKQPTIMEEVSQRRSAAEQMGLAPDDPAYDAYVLTGKMPREDQAPLTARDKQAILESDDAVFSAGNTINLLKSVITPDASGVALNDKAGSGWFAGMQVVGARNDPTGGYLFDQDQGKATTDLENIVLGQALQSLKSIFGAAPTEGERKILVDLQASIDKTPTERKAIIDRAIALATLRKRFNEQRANQLRGQEYYKPGGAPQMDEGWEDLGGGVKFREKVQ